jgi:hypothetical protein
VAKSDRSNVRQAREAARTLEFLALAGHAKKLRRSVSLEEHEAILRSPTKDRRGEQNAGNGIRGLATISHLTRPILPNQRPPDLSNRNKVDRVSLSWRRQSGANSSLTAAIPSSMNRPPCANTPQSSANRLISPRCAAANRTADKETRPTLHVISWSLLVLKVVWIHSG